MSDVSEHALMSFLTVHIVELVVQCFEIMQIGQTRYLFDSESFDLASLINWTRNVNTMNVLNEMCTSILQSRFR